MRAEAIANLSLVGKSYGASAIKVEPRALEKLPLSAAALSENKLVYELTTSSHEKFRMFKGQRKGDSRQGVLF